MASWHPPIPAEAVYRPEVAQLGAGLRLLWYCYNGLERDGTIELSLTSASEAIGTPYATVRKWWALLLKVGIATVLQDKGRSGFLVRIADDWIDWHILERNYEPAQRPTKDVEKVLNGVERSFNDLSTHFERPFKDVEQNVYGTHDPDQAPPPAATEMASTGERVAQGGGGDSHSAWDPSDPLYVLFKSDRYDIKAAKHLSVWAGQDVERVRAILEKWRKIDYDPHNPRHLGARLYGRLEVGPTAVFAAEDPKIRSPIPEPTRVPMPPDVLDPREAAAIVLRLKAEYDKKKRENAHAA